MRRCVARTAGIFGLTLVACIDERASLPVGLEPPAPTLRPGGSAPLAAAPGEVPRARGPAEGPSESRGAIGSLLARSRPPAAGIAAAGDRVSADAPHERHLLLENTLTGARAAWMVSRGAIVGAYGLGTVEPEWRIGGAGDFDADGIEDVLWENTATGSRALWLLDGPGRVRAAVALGVVPVEWRIAGAGDYDNDGRADVLWQNVSTGERALWLMRNGQVTAAISLGVLENEWRLVAADDLDSDGKDDILVQHGGDGRVVLWLMSGGRPTNAVLLGTVPLEWRVVGTGDLDGDGKADVLWEQATTGERAVWLMDGAARVLAAPLLTVESPDWHIAAVLVPPAPPADPVLVGAGDVARCFFDSDEITAALLDGIAGTIMALGDNAYERDATPARIESAYRDCYESSWGRHKARTRPAPGNHEYLLEGAPQYYAYYGEAAGPAGRGYYSYDLGSWHVISLNSNVDAGPASAQLQWLRDDLAANRTACAVAYWHHPVFSSGLWGNDPHMAEVWRLLDSAGVDVAVVSHDHHYERFAPQDYTGRADPSGIRQFVVGTGGGDLRPLGARIRANSEVRQTGTYGVLKLTLRAGSYDWEFVPEPGSTFGDAGSGSCTD